MFAPGGWSVLERREFDQLGEGLGWVGWSSQSLYTSRKFDRSIAPPTSQITNCALRIRRPATESTVCDFGGS
jgi:hypothetical protein